MLLKGSSSWACGCKAAGGGGGSEVPEDPAPFCVPISQQQPRAGSALATR